MITFGMLLAFIVLTIIFIYTVSYGIWTWNSKNRIGSVMVILLALASVMLPIYKLFFRE